MLDTNIFNKVLDGRLSFQKLPSDGTYVVTHIQVDELNSTKDVSRRNQLLSQFEALPSERAMTTSFAFDISRLDQAKWGDGVVFEVLKHALDIANDGKPSNACDALIGETCISNGFTLLTCDYHFAKAVEQQGGLVQYFDV
jgi:predicted nucleic acid-binding protein